MIGRNYEARQDRVLRAILPLSVCILGLLACARPSDAIDFYEIEIYDTDTTPAGHLQLELHSNTTSTATGHLAKSQMDVYQLHETVEGTYGVLRWLEVGQYFCTGSSRTAITNTRDRALKFISASRRPS